MAHDLVRWWCAIMDHYYIIYLAMHMGDDYVYDESDHTSRPEMPAIRRAVDALDAEHKAHTQVRLAKLDNIRPRGRARTR